MLKLALPLLAATSLLVACGDDEKSSGDAVNSETTDATSETSADTDAVDAATVKVYTSAEVCALVSQEAASATLGVEVTEVEVSDMSTPQCWYHFTGADGVRTNLTLAVQRPIEDLGGAAGKAGFDFTTSLVIFDTPYEPLAGLGDEAAVSASTNLTIIAVLAHNQVFTIASSAPIDIAGLVAFGNEVAANV